MTQSYFTFPNLDEEKVWSISTINKTEMTRLEIFLKSITRSELRQLIVSLPHTVKYLHFVLYYINSEISQVLIECLSKHPSTQSFEWISYRKIGIKEIYSISSLLNLPNIKKFELSSNSIRIEELEHFTQTLGKNSTLNELIFSWNSIGDEGALALARALLTNYSLRILDCGMNGISAKGFDAIAQALKINSSLLEIRLHWNFLGSAGAKLLAQVIKENTPLVRISISRNKIGDKGLQFIADALKYNDTLEFIDLRYNGITNQGFEYLVDTFQNNKTIQQIDIEESESQEMFKKIQSLLKRNQRILQNQRKIASIQIFETFARRTRKDIEYYLLPSLIFPMIQ